MIIVTAQHARREKPEKFEVTGNRRTTLDAVKADFERANPQFKFISAKATNGEFAAEPQAAAVPAPAATAAPAATNEDPKGKDKK